MDIHHTGKYKVFNVSERPHAEDMFDGRVVNRNWEDHQAPPLTILFKLVPEMEKWLTEGENQDHVLVIHCNSGKGRAGSACLSLLRYINFYDDLYSCARLHGTRRFTDNKTGVTQPCQVKFIHYF